MCYNYLQPKYGINFGIPSITKCVYKVRKSFPFSSFAASVTVNSSTTTAFGAPHEIGQQQYPWHADAPVTTGMWYTDRIDCSLLLTDFITRC